MADVDDVGVVNAYAREFHRGVVYCDRIEGKGRVLRASDVFEAGAVLLRDAPIRVVTEQPGHAVWDRLVELAEGPGTGALDFPPLWYWCALHSLTAEDLGEGHPEDPQRDGWAPMGAVEQRRLLLLHSGDINGAAAATVTVADQLAPGLRDHVLFEKCLQAWVMNAFAVHEEERAHAAMFLPSFISHSCFPAAVWHIDDDKNYVLRARRRIEKGEEITLSYLDEQELLSSSRARRGELARSKRFWCECRRCVGGPDESRGMRCRRCRDGTLFASRPPRGAPAGRAAGGTPAKDIRVACVLRALRPYNYDETTASDAEHWVTFGAPDLQRSSGKLYYEIVFGEGAAEPQIGWATADFQESAGWSNDGVGDDELSWAGDGERRRLWHGGAVDVEGWPGAKWATGSVIGCALDLDEGRMTFSQDGQGVPEAAFDFDPGGRAFFPAFSLQGHFALRLRAADFAFPPEPRLGFQPWLDEEAALAAGVLGALDRSSPLGVDFVGARCASCGFQADAAESARLSALEQRLESVVEAWREGRDVQAAEAMEVEGLIDGAFGQHAGASRARRRLVDFYSDQGDGEAQTRQLRACCDFAAAAYPGVTAAHAWALDSLADAIAAAADETTGAGPEEPGACEVSAAAATSGAAAASLRLAAAHYAVAQQTLEMMFGSKHCWTTEVVEKLERIQQRLRGAKQGERRVGA